MIYVEIEAALYLFWRVSCRGMQIIFHSTVDIGTIDFFCIGYIPLLSFSLEILPLRDIWPHEGLHQETSIHSAPGKKKIS
jgi:hypothetical protein